MNMGMGMGGMQGGGGVGMGMGGTLAGYGQHHPQPNRNQGPIYNPHQHVQYPYSPQPMDINPQASRGMPYTGPGINHYPPGPAPLTGMPQGHGQMSVNHTGMSQMSHMTGSYQSRMTSPMPMNMSPNAGMHQHQAGPGHGHAGHHSQHMGTHGPQMGPGGGHPMHMGHGQHGMAMGMNIPYQGQTHMHVGLGGGPMAMQNGMAMGMQMGGGMNMGMGVTNGGPYGSGPHPGLSVHSGEQGMLGKSNQVWITGEFFGVQRARDMLLNVAMQKVHSDFRFSHAELILQSKLVISRDTAILPRKLDWLLTERIEEFKAIMSDNGTYVQVPSVGSQASLITVFGDHRVNIERTIRSIMALACQFYVASFWLLPISFDVLMPSASLNPAQMQPILKRISHTTGAEVVFKSNCFEMHGLEQEVRAAVMMVLELDVIAVSLSKLHSWSKLKSRISTMKSDSRSSWRTNTVNSYPAKRTVRSTRL